MKATASSAEKTPRELKAITPPRRRKQGPRVDTRGATAEERRLAAVILEVLAGQRTPTQAAEAIGVSVPRYYALESRALGGLLEACRRRRRGPGRSAERQCQRLQGEVERLQRECSRLAALLRISQRAVGLPARSQKREKVAGGKRRRRRPTARALRAAKRLREESPGEPLVSAEGSGQDAAEVKG